MIAVGSLDGSLGAGCHKLKMTEAPALSKIKQHSLVALNELEIYLFLCIVDSSLHVVSYFVKI